MSRYSGYLYLTLFLVEWFTETETIAVDASFGVFFNVN